jgi:hypothetical protein
LISILLYNFFKLLIERRWNMDELRIETFRSTGPGGQRDGSGFYSHTYRKAMRGVWTSGIAKDTLDESPMAYKKAADILEAIHDTIEVEKRLMPVYNFKPAG